MLVYFLGFNKTATVATTELLRAAGWAVQHGAGVASSRTHAAYLDSHAVIARYAELAKQHPRAHFVLQTRPLAAWVRSRFRHTPVAEWNRPIAAGTATAWAAMRRRRHREVVRHFMASPALAARFHALDIASVGWERRHLLRALGARPPRAVPGRRHPTPKLGGRPQHRRGGCGRGAAGRARRAVVPQHVPGRAPLRAGPRRL